MMHFAGILESGSNYATIAIRIKENWLTQVHLEKGH